MKKNRRGVILTILFFSTSVIVVYQALQILQLREDLRSELLKSADYPQLQVYAHENALTTSRKQPARKVFIGDSIIRRWGEITNSIFLKPDCINRGIDQQTTSQMLLRFQSDVINLQPQIVLIEGGTNDVFYNIPFDLTTSNIKSMAEIARSHGIEVMLVSILPVNKNRESERPGNKIKLLNQWIKDYSKENNYAYLNYYDLLVDETGHLKDEFSNDGLHPNEASYAIMLLVANEAFKNP